MQTVKIIIYICEGNMRQNIILECSRTNERLYLTSKNKQNNPERLELKKYSPKSKQREIFKEVK